MKEQLIASKLPGTIRFYGTPAEEGGAGKVYMIRAGAFKDARRGAVRGIPAIATPGEIDNDPGWPTSARSVRYQGQRRSRRRRAGHGPIRARRRGSDRRMRVNLLREHVPQETRMHYVITQGGAAPTSCPTYAEMYASRAPSAT